MEDQRKCFYIFSGWNSLKLPPAHLFRSAYFDPLLKPLRRQRNLMFPLTLLAAGFFDIAI